MTWDDVEDILYDGTKEEMELLQCPNCRNAIYYKYNIETKTMEIGCLKCGYLSRGYGAYRPNCVEEYGNSYTLGEI